MSQIPGPCRLEEEAEIPTAVAPQGNTVAMDMWASGLPWRPRKPSLFWCLSSNPSLFQAISFSAASESLESRGH